MPHFSRPDQVGPRSGDGARATTRQPRCIRIRTLGPQHRGRILRHLQSLDAGDRQLRFGFAASDAHVARYVEQLDFARDELLGVFDHGLALVAMAHLALRVRTDQGDPTHTVAEFGVSVLPRQRRRGIGAQLFALAVVRARNRGVDRLVVHALSENTAMLGLARRAGAVVVHEGADATAVLRLPAGSLASHCRQALAAGAGVIDYDCKRRARRLQRWRRQACDTAANAWRAAGSHAAQARTAPAAASHADPADGGLLPQRTHRDAG